jgi:hypothetical protein
MHIKCVMNLVFFAKEFYRKCKFTRFLVLRRLIKINEDLLKERKISDVLVKTLFNYPTLIT